jgi:hypothetical protein
MKPRVVSQQKMMIWKMCWGVWGSGIKGKRDIETKKKELA